MLILKKGHFLLVLSIFKFGWYMLDMDLVQLQLISYKKCLECTLVQWRAKVAVGTFFMKSPVSPVATKF